MLRRDSILRMQRSNRSSGVDRLLDLVGADIDAALEPKLEAFRRFLLLIIAVEAWESLPFWADKPLPDLHFVKAIAYSLAAAGAWFSLARLATGAVALLMLTDLVLSFPLFANHQYLELVCLIMISLPARNSSTEKQRCALGTEVYDC